LRRGCLMNVENHDLCARRSEGKRDRSTDAATAAGYDGNLVFKQKIRNWGEQLLVSSCARSVFLKSYRGRAPPLSRTLASTIT
jgi:hypothetical protein